MHKVKTLRRIIKDIINEADESSPPSKNKKSIFNNPNIPIWDKEDPQQPIDNNTSPTSINTIPIQLSLEFNYPHSSTIHFEETITITIPYHEYWEFATAKAYTSQMKTASAAIIPHLEHAYATLTSSAKQKLKDPSLQSHIIQAHMMAAWYDTPLPRLRPNTNRCTLHILLQRVHPWNSTLETTLANATINLRNLWHSVCTGT
jgi:hypothetical protein